MVLDTSSEISVHHITGPPGRGKGCFARMSCEQYKKKFRNNEMYLFSNLQEDESLDSVNP